MELGVPFSDYRKKVKLAILNIMTISTFSILSKRIIFQLIAQFLTLRTVLIILWHNFSRLVNFWKSFAYFLSSWQILLLLIYFFTFLSILLYMEHSKVKCSYHDINRIPSSFVKLTNLATLIKV